MGLPEVQFISIEEYLETERNALCKHEYYQGEVFAMSGASLPHNLIFKNTFINLGIKLQGKTCQPFGSDLRVHIPKNTMFTYPDITIICGDPETLDDKTDTMTNPSVIIEILSKTTRDYDKGQKFTLYRDINSLKEYLLIDSESIRIEKYIRNTDDSWLLRDYKMLTDRFIIETIEEELSLEEIYAGVLK